MNLAMAIIMLWIGSSLIWVASHGTEATSPWSLYKSITDKVAQD